ncbi:MAG: signal peptide peptidase SppA [Verrucomicrobiota bacterium]
MKKTSIGCFGLFLVVLLGMSLFFNVILLIPDVDTGSMSGGGRQNVFEKITLEGSGSDHIAVIPLYGVISYGVFGEVYDSMVDDIVAKLRQAREDDKVKAIILRIDSPGGEVTASDVIYNEVVKTDEVKPVLVFMESVAASGGYYVAAGARYLMSNELTITGSIGVIIQTYNVTQLSEKAGIDVLTIKSGKMKDILNPFRETKPEEVEYLQSMINETYDKFLGIVATERNLDAAELRDTVADGRILSGKRALSAGLLDGTGYFENAIEQAEELAGLTSSRVVELKAPLSVGRFFRLFGSSVESSKTLKIQLGPEALDLQAGKLYFLSPHVFGR